MEKSQKEKSREGKGKIFLGFIIIGIFLMIMVGVVSASAPSFCSVCQKGTCVTPQSSAQGFQQPPDMSKDGSGFSYDPNDGKNELLPPEQANERKEELKKQGPDGEVKAEKIQPPKKIDFENANNKDIATDSEKMKKATKEERNSINEQYAKKENKAHSFQSSGEGTFSKDGTYTSKSGVKVKASEMEGKNIIVKPSGDIFIADPAKGSLELRNQVSGKGLSVGPMEPAQAAALANSPMCASCNSPSGDKPSGSADSSSSPVGGGAAGSGQEIIQAVSTALGLVGNLKSIEDTASANAQAKSTTSPLEQAWTGITLTDPGQGTVTATNDGQTITLDNGKAAIVKTASSDHAYSFQQLAENKPSTIEISANILKTQNTATVIDQVAVVGTVDKATIVDNADSATPTATTDSRNVGSVVAFLSLVGNVVSDVVNGEYVKFIKQDIEINGKNIVVYGLKPFDHIEGDGKDLVFGDGSVTIWFENEKTLYPRTVKNNDYFINKLTNNQDPNKYFALVPGGTKGNYFLDNKKRISVGDISVDHPTLKGIRIAEIRKDMWKDTN